MFIYNKGQGIGISICLNELLHYCNQSWNCQIFSWGAKLPHKNLRCNSFKLRIHKPRLYFCSNFSRWITVTYFSSRKLRCDRRKFQDCVLRGGSLKAHALTQAWWVREMVGENNKGYCYDACAYCRAWRHIMFIKHCYSL